ncbi:MAG: hypothetical protein M3461_11005 [Pseudomonadota bacterium]|nr:hypothetical protein [Pseudomonadota bacterium]
MNLTVACPMVKAKGHIVQLIGPDGKTTKALYRHKRLPMTNEEGELLNNIANEYWEEFGQLVARHLLRAPQHLRDELLMTLQERSSVYGCAYERHMEDGL